MNQLSLVARDAIAARVFPGCIIGILDEGQSSVLAFGRHTYEEAARAVDESTLYDCASLTKSVVTASLALHSVDSHKLGVDDPLVAYIPEYATTYREAVTVRHLLTYTLGNSVPLSRAGRSVADIFYTVCHEQTLQPGTVFNYSNTPAFLLGIVLERLLGESLNRAAQRIIFDPLGMHSATFTPSGAAPTGKDIVDTVHDESARIYAHEGRVVGHAGLFATMPDLMRFMQRALEDRDPRICTNQIPHLGASTGLGWELEQPWMGTQCPPGTFGKTGFTGCSIVANGDAQKAVVILSNRTYPERPEGREAIDGFRAAVCGIVFT